MPIDKLTYDKVKEEYKEKKVSIPTSDENPTLVSLLLYDVDFYESVKKENPHPNLMDGLMIKGCVLDYFVGNEKKVCIDYSNPELITFPQDVTYPDGSKGYCPLGMVEMMNIYRITKKKSIYGGMANPANESTCAILYDSSFQLQYGTPEGLLIDMIMGLKLSDLKPEEISGFTMPAEMKYPIIKVYRYLDWKYGDKAWDKTVRPWRLLPDAKKDKAEIKYMAWNRKDKVSANLPVEYISESTTALIMEALRNRKKESETEGTPF